MNQTVKYVCGFLGCFSFSCGYASFTCGMGMSRAVTNRLDDALGVCDLLQPPRLGCTGSLTSAPPSPRVQRVSVQGPPSGFPLGPELPRKVPLLYHHAVNSVPSCRWYPVPCCMPLLYLHAYGILYHHACNSVPSCGSNGGGADPCGEWKPATIPPVTGPGSSTTWNSQSTYVFPLKYGDQTLFIYM